MKSCFPGGMPGQRHFAGQLVSTLLLAIALLAACVPASTPTPTPAGLANPASENCIQQGGTLSIETRSDGGQYGVCLFEDNQQCEEWAMLRGDCPVGGIRVTGYVTPAARYCAITGGTYAVTGEANTENETGTCTFKNGAQCDAADHYNGKCDASTHRQERRTPVRPRNGLLSTDSGSGLNGFVCGLAPAWRKAAQSGVQERIA